MKYYRTHLASIGRTSTLAKNLDEYQYIVCSEIRSISDINPYKRELQKYRVLIIASFTKLIDILTSLRSDRNLQQWNRFAQILLTQVSETLVKLRFNQKRYDGTNSKLMRCERISQTNRSQMKPVFEFFGVPEEEVDSLLESIYWQL